ncbi:alpha/beta hydrolase [Pseudonocardia xishanensis]|uniref:Alpha/beta fold hydrolase n=1 Tax=Pseudonocardia xishanensis TaxID=630995 RepID=A0ABP8S2K4_9PSEU
MQQADVDTGSFRTHYYAAGPEGAPVVVLLHDGAWGGDGQVTWSEVMQDLATDYRVYAPDLLGFGRSDKVVYLGRAPYAPRVRQIADFCGVLGIERAHFVGTSFGGSVVLRAAEARAWPAASLTTIGGAGGPFRTQRGIDVLGELQPGEEYLAEVVELLTNSRSGYEDNVALRRTNTLAPGHYGAMVAPRLKHPEGAPAREPDGFPGTLRDADAPVWLVEMSDDLVIEAGWAKEIATAAPNCRVLELAGPHSPNLTAPTELAGHLREIFAEA